MVWDTARVPTREITFSFQNDVPTRDLGHTGGAIWDSAFRVADALTTLKCSGDVPVDRDGGSGGVPHRKNMVWGTHNVTWDTACVQT